MLHFPKNVFSLTALFTLLFSANIEAIDQKYYTTTSEEKKFVWFRVAKTATRTTYHLFLNHIPDLVHRTRGIFYKPKYNDYFKFSFVRNPWARVVSCYHNKVVTRDHVPFKECWDKDFEYFVDFIARQDLKTADRHIRLQSELMPVDKLDFIGRLENFSEDIKHVLSVIKIENYAIQNFNTSKHDHYSIYYNERTMDIIYNKYKTDIERFGYAFEKDPQ